MQKIRGHLKYNLFYLGLLGLWTDTVRFRDAKLYWFYFFLGICCFFTPSTVSIMMYSIKSMDNLEHFAESAYIGLMCSLANFKAFYLTWNRGQVMQIFALLDDDVLQPRDDVQRRRFDAYMRRYKFFFGCFVTECLIFDVVLFAQPFLNGTYGQGFPVPAWFPYDVSAGSMNYLLSYVHQNIGLVYSTMTSLSVDCSMIALIALIAAECDLLANSIRKLEHFSKKALNKEVAIQEEVDVEMGKQLLLCMDHHKKIINLTENIKGLLNTYMLCQFGVSVVAIGLAMFQLSVLVPGSEMFISMAFYTFGIFIQLLFFCWFGNEVIIKSLDIPAAIFECDWIDTSITLKKNLIFFMLRTQRPLKIYGIDFFEVSLETFKTVMKTAWSTFTLLNNVHQKKSLD